MQSGFFSGVGKRGCVLMCGCGNQVKNPGYTFPRALALVSPVAYTRTSRCDADMVLSPWRGSVVDSMRGAYATAGGLVGLGFR